MGVTESKVLAEGVLAACRHAENEGKSMLDDGLLWNNEVFHPSEAKCSNLTNVFRLYWRLRETFTDTSHRIYVTSPVDPIWKKGLPHGHIYLRICRRLSETFKTSASWNLVIKPEFLRGEVNQDIIILTVTTSIHIVLKPMGHGKYGLHHNYLFPG